MYSLAYLSIVIQCCRFCFSNYWYWYQV